MAWQTLEPTPPKIEGNSQENCKLTDTIPVAVVGLSFKEVEADNARKLKIKNSKILHPASKTKNCSKCKGYMTLSKRGGYTCINRICLDKRYNKRAAKREIVRRQSGEKPLFPRTEYKDLIKFLG